MQRARPVTIGFAVMLVIVALWLLLLVFSIINQWGMTINVTLNIASIAMVLILLGEAMFYWHRRFKIANKVWVHIHAWSTLVALVILPLIGIVLLYDQAMYQSETEYQTSRVEVIMTIVRILQYVFWGLIAIGHIFFIATIVKSFQIKAPQPDESPGLLDEFTDRR